MQIQPDSDSTIQLSSEFDEPSVEVWISQIRTQQLKNALPSLLVKLDTLSKADVPPSRRITLLQMVKDPVVKALSHIPSPVHERGGNIGLTIEQRLLLMMINNMWRALQEVDRSRTAFSYSEDEDRDWVLRNLFRFIGRQVLYGIKWGRPWPKMTWQQLHDVFVYLVVRGAVHLNVGVQVVEDASGFDPETEYKRLLLIGIAYRLGDRHRLNREFLDNTRTWAALSELQDVQRMSGDETWFEVEVTSDEPPRLRRHGSKHQFRGWALQPPTAFFDFLKNSPQPQSDETIRLRSPAMLRVAQG